MRPCSVPSASRCAGRAARRAAARQRRLHREIDHFLVGFNHLVEAKSAVPQLARIVPKSIAESRILREASHRQAQ